MAKNNIAYTVPPPSFGSSCATTSSYDVCIMDNMNKTMFPPSNVCFTYKMDNQDKTPSLSMF